MLGSLYFWTHSKVGDCMNDKAVHQLDQIRNEWYGHETMKWYGWGSPIGLGLGLGALMVSLGVFLYLLHIAKLVG
jgi:hypothetical protein